MIYTNPGLRSYDNSPMSLHSLTVNLIEYILSETHAIVLKFLHILGMCICKIWSLQTFAVSKVMLKIQWPWWNKDYY